MESMCYPLARGGKENILCILEHMNHGEIMWWVVASLKEFENVQKHFCNLRNKHHTPSYLRRDHLPLRTWPWKGLSNTCLGFKKVPHVNFLEVHGKQAKISKRHIKVECFVPVGCKIWQNGLVDGVQHTCFMMHYEIPL